MIQLNGLSQYQVEMLDMMWSLDTFDEYNQWWQSLGREDQILADALQQMIIAEALEEDLGEFKEAKSLLSKFAL
jgi:hypothetical protein